MGVWCYSLKKHEAFYAELNYRAEAATSSYSALSILTISIVISEPLNWKKTYCGCLCFAWLRLLIAIMKRCTECYALQFYHTSLICWVFVGKTAFFGDITGLVNFHHGISRSVKTFLLFNNRLYFKRIPNFVPSFWNIDSDRFYLWGNIKKCCI